MNVAAGIAGKPGDAAAAGAVWAVVVHYGDAGSTRRTLAALGSGDVAPDVTLVVDNGGGFDAGEAAVRVLRPLRNLGFAGGAAEGARRALAGGAAWVWFVNDDAAVGRDCLAELLRAAAQRPRAGLLSPVIAYPEAGIWYSGGEVDAGTLAVRHLQDRPAGARETGYVTGCAMLASAALLREAGGFDERLFMYCEDVDLSLRAVAAGWELLVVPGATVVHDVARRDGRRVFSAPAVYLLVRNRLLLAGRRGATARALAPVLAWGVRQVVKGALHGEGRALARAVALGLRDGLRGADGPPPPRVRGVGS